MIDKIEKKRNIRIFLSSTFIDLNDERTYLMNIIFPELIRISRKRNVNLTFVDLRWGINEPEFNKINNVADKCFEQIDNARPFFIGILAGRYGWVPKDDTQHSKINDFHGHSRAWFKNGYSMTHMEMEYGVFLKPDNAEYSYFYFKSDKSIDVKYKENNPDYEKRLEALKSKIKINKSKWHWSKNDFSNAQELGEQVKDDYIKLLDSLYPENKELSAVDKEREIQREYSRFLLNNYIRIDEDINNIINGINDNNWFLVTGPVGIGKSSTLAEVAREYRNKNKNSLVIEHYIGSGGSDSLYGISLRIINEIRDYLKKRNIALPLHEMPKSQDEILKALPVWITSLPDYDKSLILIDGVDQLPSPNEMVFLAYLPRSIKVLISSRNDTDATKYLSVYNLKSFELKPIKDEKRIAIINNILKSQGKELTEKQIKKITNSNETGNPLYLRILMDELSKISKLKNTNEKQNDFMDKQIENYLKINDINGLYNSMMDRIENMHKKYFKNSKDVKNVLISIVLSRSGLLENEIILINKISTISFEIIRNEMDYHLSDKSGLMDFFHYSLNEAVRKRYIKDPEFEKLNRDKIIEWFDSHPESERKFYELPYQLYLTDNKKLLSKNLKKMEWFDFFTENQYDMKYYEFFNYLRFVSNNICQYLKNTYEKKILDTGNTGYIVLLGSLCYNNVCYKQAEELLKKALEIDKRIYGINHPDVATGMVNIANLYYDQGKYSDAEELLKEALEIHRNLFGNLNERVANVLSNLGVVYDLNKKYKESLECFKEALETYIKLNEKSHSYEEIINDIQNYMDNVRGKL